jgi:Ca2+-binding EF-hand superfamily protein
MSSRWNQNFAFRATDDPLRQASNEAACQAVIRAAKRVFKEIDGDGSGSLERPELEVLVQELRKRLGASLLPGDEVTKQVDQLLRQFDTNHSGTIEPDEFLKMIVRKPWSSMLPADVVDNMPQMVAESMLDSKPMRKYRKSLFQEAAQEAASKGVILAAKKIFRSVDGDGNGKLDRDELGCLVQEMRRSMGHDYHSQVAISREVDAVLDKFDINRDGDISFDEFLRMIVSEPWNVLLPADVRGKLHETVIDTVSDAPVHKRERDTVFRTAALEAAARSVLVAAKKLFREIDSNGDGQLDRIELAHAISALWAHVGDPISSRDKLDTLTMDALNNFDADNNGLISFKEFVRMISNPPWDQLLPPDVQAKMHSSLMDAHTDTPAQRKVRDEVFRDVAVAAAAKGVIKACQELFADVDGNGDGQLNEAELECLVQLVHSRMAPGTAPIPQGDLRQQVTDVMDRFDTNGSGAITFDEFMQMMTTKPWCWLLPEGVQGFLENKTRRKTQRPLGQSAASQTSSAAVIRAAKNLFGEVDMDGNGWIDQDELYWLLKKLQKRMGTGSSMSREEMESMVGQAMATFDIGRTGSLSFHEFLRMITTKPWSDTLPKEVQKYLPTFVVQPEGANASPLPLPSPTAASGPMGAMHAELLSKANKAGSVSPGRSNGVSSPRDSSTDGGAPSPTNRAIGAHLQRYLEAHPGHGESVARVFEFYCSSGEYREMNTMRPRMFLKFVRDAGLLDEDFTHDNAVRVLNDAQPEHRPRLAREHFDHALILLCKTKFIGSPALDAITALLEKHVVPLDQDNLRFGADYHIHHPQVVDIAYEYDEYLRFVYFYYTQESRMMRFDDFMLFAEDFVVCPDMLPRDELGRIFHESANAVRAGHVSYHEFVVILSRCALKTGGQSAMHAVNDFLEHLIGSDAYQGIEQWFRDLQFSGTPPAPLDWQLGAPAASPRRSQSPAARSQSPAQPTRGRQQSTGNRVATPKARSPSPYSRSSQAWENALSSDSLGLLYEACRAYRVDLDRLFGQYSSGQEQLSASQFYQFAWDALLIDDAANVDAFFLMAIGSHYRTSLRIGFDRYQAGLVRAFENIAATRGIDLARACDIFVRDHILPIVAERAAGWMYPPEYRSPMKPVAAVPQIRSPLRAAERSARGSPQRF